MRYKTLDSGEKISMYKSYIPGTDNNERLAQNQSGWEQTINGLGKAGTNIGSVVLGNTVGFVYGLTDWAKTGNFNSVFDIPRDTNTSCETIRAESCSGKGNSSVKLISYVGMDS